MAAAAAGSLGPRCRRLWLMIACAWFLSGMRIEQSNFQSTKGSIKKTTRSNKHGGRTDSAFFTLLAGIDPKTTKPVSSPHSYLGYLLHLATVRYMLDYTGSTMDFVILLRLANTPSTLDDNNTLPESQQAYFSKLNMKIEYLPQGKKDEWDSYMMEKFHILRFHQYKHILFLDADVLPLCNLDVYFDMSDQGIFAPNYVFAYKHEPAQGGFFLISPEPGDWELYHSMPAFINRTVGFGSPLTGLTEDIKRNYTDWNWHGVHLDQGLLYHWVRYVKKNVTIANKNRIQTLSEQGGHVKVVHEIRNFSVACPSPRDVWRPENMDFVHFTGIKRKPWIRNWTSTVQRVASDDDVDTKDVQVAWAVTLRAAWRKYELGPLRTLMPSLPKSFDQKIEEIEAFLNS